MAASPDLSERAPTLSEDLVRLAYQLLLGREVESDRALRAHMALGTLPALRKAIMSSAEFKAKMLHTPAAAPKWVAADVLGRFTMWVNLSDRYVSYGCLNNSWEPSETAYVTSRLRAGDVVLDIGANIGWFSLVAAKCTGKSGRVHAFEPHPQTAAMLKRTVAENDLRSQVSVWEFALSDKWGKADLNWGRGTDNPGGAFLGAAGATERGKFESVAVTTAPLDELLPEVAPDFIKIDVEGAEARALNGAKRAIRNRRPAVLSELYPRQLRSVSGVTPAQYIGQMKDLGYSCYLLEDGRPTQKLTDFPADQNRELVSVVFEYTGKLT